MNRFALPVVATSISTKYCTSVWSLQPERNYNSLPGCCQWKKNEYLEATGIVMIRNRLPAEVLLNRAETLMDWADAQNYRRNYI